MFLNLFQYNYSNKIYVIKIIITENFKLYEISSHISAIVNNMFKIILYQASSPERDEKAKEKPAEETILIENENKDIDSPDSGFPDDAFLMVSQLQWEDDVIWDGSEIKHKV